jgi:hypothetical protein
MLSGPLIACLIANPIFTYAFFFKLDRDRIWKLADARINS